MFSSSKVILSVQSLCFINFEDDMITFLYYSLIAFVAFFIVAHIYYRSKDRIAPLGIGGADFVRLTIEIFKDISSLVKKNKQKEK